MLDFKFVRWVINILPSNFYSFDIRPFSWKKDDFSESCLNANNIDKCDKRPLGWSDCTEADNYGDRFRYCTISKKDYDVHNSCIIEEILNSKSQLCF